MLAISVVGLYFWISFGKLPVIGQPPIVTFINMQITITSGAIALLCLLLRIIFRKKHHIVGKSNLQISTDKLSEFADKSEVIINAIGDGVMAIDSLGVIQLINPAAQNILGWSKQDALSLNYKSVLKLVNQKSEELSSADNPINQALNLNQEIRTNDLTLLTKNDKKLSIALVASPVSEVPSGIIIVFRDITSEKAAEREQSEFISTASHEMRTPVASIEGYLGLVLNPQTAQIDDRARDFILKAHDAAQHLGHLFKDLLDVSKVTDGRLSNNPKSTNIISYLKTIVQGLGQQATDKGIKLIYNPTLREAGELNLAPAYMADIDDDHLREVMDNLIENAIKYTPKGEVVVDVTGDDDTITISIKDSGIGIPEEDMPHLFQKFYRVSNKETNDIGGTGLGLYLSRRLVEVMGGRIWAESVYKVGTTFFVQLPRNNGNGNTNLIEQQLQKTKQIEDDLPIVTSGPTMTQQTSPDQTNNVPRGQALTPEQIAQYARKQSELAKASGMQPMPARTSIDIVNPRPQSISIPTRELKK